MTYRLTFLISMAMAIPFASISVAQTIDAATRTVTTANFQVTWNSGVDTEAITSLIWMGGPNLTATYLLDTCSQGDNVEYFGNAWAPPDPQAGGIVLVGGGTSTPPGTVAWSGTVLGIGTDQVTINSSSTNCSPQSAGINVQTTYRFFNPHNSGANWFQVQRVFDFSATTFAHDLRPYIPRLNIAPGYTEVLYPATGGTLAVTSATACSEGCTGPHSAPGASSLSPTWASSQGWFAIHNPTTLQGVVVRRVQSADPQGDPIASQLWVDYDGPVGSYETNASSFLLLSPAAGFTGGLLTEVETLCFYNSTLWTPSLIPPPGCFNAPLTVFPGSITFSGQAVGSTSASKVAVLKNVGTVAVTIGGIAASGDFGQENNCPASLAAGASCNIAVAFKPLAAGIQSGSVSIVDALNNSPQTIGLAGLGLAPQ